MPVRAENSSILKWPDADQVGRAFEAWGQVVARLLQELPATVAVPEGLADKARVLDSFQVPTRYPNGHAAGSPGQTTGACRAKGGSAMRARPKSTEQGEMREYLVVIEQDDDGRYVGEVPELKGCYSEGETLDELLGNIKEAIDLCAEQDPEGC